METSNFVTAYIEDLSRDPDLLKEIETVVDEMRAFVHREEFPSKSTN